MSTILLFYLHVSTPQSIIICAIISHIFFSISQFYLTCYETQEAHYCIPFHIITYHSISSHTYWYLSTTTLSFQLQFHPHIMTEKSPKVFSLFDPTSHYFLKSTDYGPLTIINILQDSQNYYPWNWEMTIVLSLGESWVLCIEDSKGVHRQIFASGYRAQSP